MKTLTFKQQTITLGFAGDNDLGGKCEFNLVFNDQEDVIAVANKLRAASDWLKLAVKKKTGLQNIDLEIL